MLATAAPAARMAERERVQAWLSAHPEAWGAFIDRTLGLREELSQTRREIDSLERARRMGQPAVPSPDELRRQSEAWDRLLGTAESRRASRSVQEAPSRPTVRTSRSARTLEDVGVRLLTDHAGKVWLILALVSVFAVMFRDRLV